MPHVLTKTVTAYKFSELSDSAKQKALEKMYDINVNDFFWYEFDFEDFKVIGKILGIDIEEIYFSGFSSQGDGACFKGSYSYARDSLKQIVSYAPKDETLHTIASNLRALQSRHFYKLSAKIKHSGHYSHAYCTSIDIFKRDNEGYASDYLNIPDKDIKELQEILRDFMNWMYKSLNKNYDYLTSEEAIIETIEANDYDFTEAGVFPAI